MTTERILEVVVAICTSRGWIPLWVKRWLTPKYPRGLGTSLVQLNLPMLSSTKKSADNGREVSSRARRCDHPSDVIIPGN